MFVVGKSPSQWWSTLSLKLNLDGQNGVTRPCVSQLHVGHTVRTPTWRAMVSCCGPHAQLQVPAPKWLLSDPYHTRGTAPRYPLLSPYPCSSEMCILQTTLKLPPHLEIFYEGMRMHWTDDDSTWQQEAFAIATFIALTADADPTD